MYENKIDNQQRAVLVAVDTSDYDVDISLLELEELASTAGAVTVAKMTQKRDALDRSTAIGSGRLEEIKEFAENNDIDLLIFDHELSGSQKKNIEDFAGISVIDRTTLILDIFAQRANTQEGRLQVELAQLRYNLPRLLGQGSALSRLGGGIGTRGPGETKLETDKRHIKERISNLEHKIKELESHRGLIRERRKKDGHITVAIVGYTNVGKSSLLNALTNAQVFSEDMLFATLDPTVRAMNLKDGRTVLLVDTVGLVRRLPHHLVKAFRSTLEEATNADLILSVCDISSDEFSEQLEVTNTLLKDLGACEIPIVTVYNKCDKAEVIPYNNDQNTVLISAKTSFGFDKLEDAIINNIRETSRHMLLKIPYDKANLIAPIRDDGKIFHEEYLEDGIKVDALVDVKLIKKMEQYDINKK